MIRPARLEDVPRLNALMHECGLALEGIAYDRWGPVTLVYERQGEIIGLVQALLGMPYAIITEMAVRPDVQHHGLGVKLMEHMETVLRCAGMTTWVTFTSHENVPVQVQLDGYGARCVGTGVGYAKGL